MSFRDVVVGLVVGFFGALLMGHFGFSGLATALVFATICSGIILRTLRR